MSKQKILTVVSIALLVIMVIVAYGYKGKYDDTSALLVAAQTDAADQKKASEKELESLTAQLAEVQGKLDEALTENESSKSAIEELSAAKEAAEKQAKEYEAGVKKAEDMLAANEEALKAAEADLEAGAAVLAETEAALKQMTSQYNRASADYEAKSTRYNIVRKKLDELGGKYDQLSADKAKQVADLETLLAEKTALEAEIKKYEEEIEKLTAEEVEYIEPDRYESMCGISFVLPEGAEIGAESSKMVEILLEDDASIKVNMSTGRVNILWYDADIETVNQFTSTIKIN